MTPSSAFKIKTLAVSAALACAGLVGTAQAETTVRLGFAAPLTGPQAHYGEDMRNGLTLALEEANAKGIKLDGDTAKFVLVSKDDQADPRTAVQVAQQIADAKVNGMLGHFNSGTTIPASRVYNDAGIPQIAMATSPEYTLQGYDTTFRMMTSDTQQGAAVGVFIVKDLKAKKVAVIDDRTAYGQGLADETAKAVKESGGEVVAREFTTDKATDFNAILTKIRATNPEVIFYGGMDAQAGPMVRQMKQLGITAKFLTGDGGCSPEMIKLAGDGMSSSAYCSMPGLPLEKMPGGADFRERYKKRFNADVQVYSPYAYDAAMAIITAMQKADSVEPSKYLPELKNSNFPGVIGNVSFDANGDIKEGAVTIYNFKDGAWVPL